MLLLPTAGFAPHHVYGRTGIDPALDRSTGVRQVRRPCPSGVSGTSEPSNPLLAPTPMPSEVPPHCHTAPEGCEREGT